jgi:hypothetical protein
MLCRTKGTHYFFQPDAPLVQQFASNSWQSLGVLPCPWGWTFGLSSSKKFGPAYAFFCVHERCHRTISRAQQKLDADVPRIFKLRSLHSNSAWSSLARRYAQRARARRRSRNLHRLNSQHTLGDKQLADTAAIIAYEHHMEKHGVFFVRYRHAVLHRLQTIETHRRRTEICQLTGPA